LIPVDIETKILITSWCSTVGQSSKLTRWEACQCFGHRRNTISAGKWYGVTRTKYKFTWNDAQVRR